jgi:hypothetical protein
MPSGIIEDESRSEPSRGLQPRLYEENNKRVVTTLRSLGSQKRGKYTNPEIDEYIKALSFYNERVKFIEKGLEQ